MIKIWSLYLTFFFFIFIVSCASQKTTVKITEPLTDTSSNQPIEFPIQVKPTMASYHKHYKFTTAEGNIRAIERIYFGPQTDILRDFANLESNKKINKEDYIKYPMASFFSETAIQIPKEKMAKAKEIYKPLIDTIFKKNENKSSIYIEILILGYTDLSPIDNNSMLYQDVKLKSQKSILTPNEFYLFSSYYRAKEIATMISSLIDVRESEFKNYNKIIIDIIQEGKGIEIPDSKREYETVDPKRRIAKVYYKITKL